MKCSNCGAELSQGTLFCASCGAPVAQQPEPQYQAPVQPQYQAPMQPQRPVSKKQYIATMASEKVKKSQKLAPIIALVCAAILLIGYFVAAGTPLYDLPVVSLVIPEDERDDMKDQMDDMADQEDEVKDRMEAVEDAYSKKEMKIAEQCVDATLAVAKNPSIGNMQKLANALKKADGTDLARDLDIDDMEEFTEIVGLLNGMLIGGLIWVLLFTLLGGLCKSKGLAVAGMIFSVFYTLPMAGVIFTILSIAGHIVLINQLGVADKEYAAYKKSLRA